MPTKRGGIFLAKVTGNQDSKNWLGRLEVELPGYGSENKHANLRMTSLAASKNCGVVWLPDKGDELVVVSTGNEFISLGSVYNGDMSPPYSNEDGNNEERLFLTPAGNELRFSDKGGKEVIRITSVKDVLIQATGEGSFYVEAAKDIDVEAKEYIKAKAGKDIEVDAKGEIKVKSGKSITVEAQQDITIKATATLNLQGQVVNIKGSAINLQRA